MAEGDGQRNFRSSYYEKLGFYGNEEKNILDLLLASSPFDFEKIDDLCERLELDRRRIEAWKILLGVDCGRKNPFDEYANIRRVRAEHFQSLKHHLEVLLRHNLVMRDRLNKCSKSERIISESYVTKAQRLYNNKSDQLMDEIENSNVYIKHTNGADGESNIAKSDNTESGAKEPNCSDNGGESSGDKSDSSGPGKNLLREIETNYGKLITLMFLLEDGKLDSSDIDTQLDSHYCRKLLAMALFFVNVSNDLQEAFFLFRNFTRKLEENEANSAS